MSIPLKSNAYIDAANLHKGVLDLGWQIDYRRFRSWLREKYSVNRAYLFIGLIPKYKDKYTVLQEAGFTLQFKEVTYDGDGKAKGNCDADLVLWTVRHAYENAYEQAVIVSSDGDYAGLVSFLMEKNKLKAVLSPGARDHCSILLKRTNAPILFINEVRSKIESIKEKTPGTAGTAQGSFS